MSGTGTSAAARCLHTSAASDRSPVLGNQRSRLLVDGQPVGEWTSGLAPLAGRWTDQTIEIPTALTPARSGSGRR